MLVLSREPGESIVIAPGTPYETTVTLLRVRGDSVRLGFESPEFVTIRRKEVQDRSTTSS